MCNPVSSLCNPWSPILDLWVSHPRSDVQRHQHNGVTPSDLLWLAGLENRPDAVTVPFGRCICAHHVVCVSVAVVIRISFCVLG